LASSVVAETHGNAVANKLALRNSRRVNAIMLPLATIVRVCLLVLVWVANGSAFMQKMRKTFLGIAESELREI
jgi:hypothetical protein